MRLLIADDEDGIRELVRMTLEEDSYEIFEARDGDEALTMALEHRPDLAFLDITMPGPSGVEVCRRLKSDPKTRDIMVVLLTANAQERDRAEGLAAGADDYFTKPFSPLAVIGVVEDVLARGRA